MDGDQPQPDHEPMPAEAPVAQDDLEPQDDPAADSDDWAGLDDLPEPPQSGDDAVDQVTAELARAMRAPLEEQLAAFERTHRTLQDRLADVEN
jgi:hypothetical protein